MKFYSDSDIATMKRTVSRNNWEDLITLIECGASNTSGPVELFFLPDNMGHGMVGSRQVRIESEYVRAASCTVKIDNLMNELGNGGSVDIIKIDTEGHELLALQGAAGLLADKHKRPRYI